MYRWIYEVKMLSFFFKSREKKPEDQDGKWKRLFLMRTQNKKKINIEIKNQLDVCKHKIIKAKFTCFFLV